MNTDRVLKDLLQALISLNLHQIKDLFKDFHKFCLSLVLALLFGDLGYLVSCMDGPVVIVSVRVYLSVSGKS